MSQECSLPEKGHTVGCRTALQTALIGRIGRVDTAEEGLYWGVWNWRRQVAAAGRVVHPPLIARRESPAQYPALSGRRVRRESFGGPERMAASPVVRSVTENRGIMSSTFDIVAEVISETSEIPRDQITPDVHAIDDLGIDSLDFLDIVFALDKKFGIKIPLEAWTEDVNQGRAKVEDYFVLKNLCARIDELVAAKNA
jgi:acyl carrier protein